VTESRVLVRPDTYVDSVVLMSTTRAMQDADGVEFASAVMGTKANRQDLRTHGVTADELERAGVNDLVLAVVAGSGEQAEAALGAGERALSGGGPEEEEEETGRAHPRSLREAVEALPGANVALISVPGEYAALEAHKALTAGLHVLLFSDNVPVEDEVELKRRAADLGLLVMGPGAGTGMLGGTGLGFANVVSRGPVGVVAAAGTGAQEVMALLDRWGSGVSSVIGVGGRDLSAEVEGVMTKMGIRSLEADQETEALLVVSKPPAPRVAEDLLGRIERRPAVAAFIGLRQEVDAPDGVFLARTLEEGAARTLDALGRQAPDPAEGLADLARRAIDRIGQGRSAVRGLFSGGTLCYESMVVLSERLGPVHSNVPLEKDWKLPAPPGAHVCLDLGEEEYTRGRPHPMMDPEPRADRIIRETEDGDVAVILLDIVLGYGGHPDPASVLAKACRVATGVRIAVVAHVVGTDRDPQGYDDQCRQLKEAGCLLAPTGARAALLAAAIAAREPEMAEATP
jgi:FdrA protein